MSRLMAAISGTLQAHLAATVTLCIHPPPTLSHLPPRPTFSSLYSLWVSNSPTQNILFASHIVLDLSLSEAVQEISTRGSICPLDNLAKEIQNSLSVLYGLMQGKALEGNGDCVKTDSNTGYDLSSDVNLLSSGSHTSSIERKQAGETLKPQILTAGLKLERVSPDLYSRLQKVAATLHNFMRRVDRLRELIKMSPSQSLVDTIAWSEMLHFEWLTNEQTFQMSALNSSLSVSSRHFFTSSPLLLDVQGEKYLQHMLLMLMDGHNVLLVGPAVGCFTHLTFSTLLLLHFSFSSFLHPFFIFLSYLPSPPSISFPLQSHLLSSPPLYLTSYPHFSYLMTFPSISLPLLLSYFLSYLTSFLSHFLSLDLTSSPMTLPFILSLFCSFYSLPPSITLPFLLSHFLSFYLTSSYLTSFPSISHPILLSHFLSF